MNSKEIYIAFCTLYVKEVRRFIRIWVQTLLPPVITMVLYFFIFGSLIGARIGSMDGYPYITYVVPGLVMMSMITNSFANVVSSFFGNKFQGSLQELLISPTPVMIIIAGYCLGGITRGLIVGVLVTLVSYIFTSLPISNIFTIMLVFFLTSIVFSLAGLINGIFARTFDNVSIITTFVLTPLTYLGGVFYSINLLSEPWRTLSLANPILYMVNAFRYGFLGVSDVSIGVCLVILFSFATVLLATAYYLLKTGKGIRY